MSSNRALVQLTEVIFWAGVVALTVKVLSPEQKCPTCDSVLKGVKMFNTIICPTCTPRYLRA